MIQKKFLLTSAAVFTLLLSQPVLAETLEEAVAFAAVNHPSIMASDAAEQGAKQTITEEKSAYYPRANANASFGRVYADNTTTRGLSVVRGTGYSWYGEGSGSLTQTLYDWNATGHSVGSAKAKYESLRATTTGAEQAIAIESSTAYVRLFRDIWLLEEAKSYSADAYDYYHRIRTAFENGGADESEVSRAQDILSLANNMVVQYEGNVMIGEADFRQTVGRMPVSALTMPKPNVALMPASAEAATAMAMSLNGQIGAADYEKLSSQEMMEKESTNLLPRFEAELSLLKRDQKDLIGGETTDGRALIRANWDYAFGGAQRAAQKRAAMKVQESEYNYETTQRAVSRDIQVAWVSMNLAANQKKNQYDRLVAAEKTLETYMEQYEGGQQSLLEMMSAKAAVFSARQDYLMSAFDELSAVYTVMGLVGIPFYNEVEMANIAQGEVYDTAE